MAVSAASEFIREVQNAEVQLQKVARKLEQEFADRYQSGVNPLVLVQRIQKLQQELPELMLECQSLLQRKQELIDAAKQQLLANRTRVQQLAARSGLQLEEDDDMVSSFTEALSEWDRSVAARNRDALGNPASQYSREDLNRALAGSMLAH